MEERFHQSDGGKGRPVVWSRETVLGGILAGVLAGAVSIAYRLVLAAVGKFSREVYTWAQGNGLLMLAVFAGLVVLGLVVGVLVKWVPLSSGSGIPQIQGEITDEIDMRPWPVLGAKFLGGFLANAAGLSLGREGPSIQLGGAVGKLLSRLFKRDQNEENYLVTAGASAGLAAAFNAPISGLLFAVEELHKKISPLLMISVFLASITADYLSKQCFGMKPIFHFSLERALPPESYGWLIVLGIACGLVGVLFNFVLLAGQDIYKKLPVPKVMWAVIAFLLSGVVAFTFPYIQGGGHDMLEQLAEHPEPLGFLLLLLFLKIVFTSASYGSAVQGGIFLPVLAIGGVTGAVVLRTLALLGMVSPEYYVNFIVLAMGGVLCGVIRTPILSVLLVTEMTGEASNILSLCLVVAIAYLTAELLKSKPIYESLFERLLAGKAAERGDAVVDADREDDPK